MDKDSLQQYLNSEHERILRESEKAHPNSGGHIDYSKEMCADTAESIFQLLNDDKMIQSLLSCETEVQIEKKIGSLKKECHIKIGTAINASGRLKVRDVIWKGMQSTFKTLVSELKHTLSEKKLEAGTNGELNAEVLGLIQPSRMVNLLQIKQFLHFGIFQMIKKSDIEMMLHDALVSFPITKQDTQIITKVLNFYINALTEGINNQLDEVSKEHTEVSLEEVQKIICSLQESITSKLNVPDGSNQSSFIQGIGLFVTKMNALIMSELGDLQLIIDGHVDFYDIIDNDKDSVNVSNNVDEIFNNFCELRKMHFEKIMFIEEEKILHECTTLDVEFVNKLNALFHGGMQVWTIDKCMQHQNIKSELDGVTEESHVILGSEEQNGKKIFENRLDELLKSSTISKTTEYLHWLKLCQKSLTKENFGKMLKVFTAKIFLTQIVGNSLSTEIGTECFQPITVERYNAISKNFRLIEKNINALAKEITVKNEVLSMDEVSAVFEKLRTKLQSSSYMSDIGPENFVCDFVIDDIHYMCLVMFGHSATIDYLQEAERLHDICDMLFSTTFVSPKKFQYWDAITDYENGYIKIRSDAYNPDCKLLRKTEKTELFLHPVYIENSQKFGVMKEHEMKKIFREIATDLDNVIHGGKVVTNIDNLIWWHDEKVTMEFNLRKSQEKKSKKEKGEDNIKQQQSYLMVDDANLSTVERSVETLPVENSSQVSSFEFDVLEQMSQERKCGLKNAIQTADTLAGQFALQRVGLTTGSMSLREKLGSEYREKIEEMMDNPTPENFLIHIRVAISKMLLNLLVLGDTNIIGLYGILTFDHIDVDFLKQLLATTEAISKIEYDEYCSVMTQIEKECMSLMRSERFAKQVWTKLTYFQYIQNLENILQGKIEYKDIVGCVIDNLYTITCILLDVDKKSFADTENIAGGVMLLFSPINIKALKKDKYGLFTSIVTIRYAQAHCNIVNYLDSCDEAINTAELEFIRGIECTDEEKEILCGDDKKKFLSCLVELSNHINDDIHGGISVRDCVKSYEHGMRMLNYPSTTNKISLFEQEIIDFVNKHKKLIIVNVIPEVIEPSTNSFQLIDLDRSEVDLLQDKISQLHEMDNQTKIQLGDLQKENQFLKEKLELSEQLEKRLSMEVEKLKAKKTSHILRSFQTNRIKKIYEGMQRNRPSINLRVQERKLFMHEILLPLRNFAEQERLTNDELEVLKEMWNYFYRTLEIKNVEGVMDIANKALIFQSWTEEQVQESEKLSRAWARNFPGMTIEDVLKKIQTLSQLNNISTEEMEDMIPFWKEWKKRFPHAKEIDKKEVSTIFSTQHTEKEVTSNKFEVYEEIYNAVYQAVSTFIETNILLIDARFQVYCEEHDITQTSITTYVECIKVMPMFINQRNSHRTPLFKKLLNDLEEFDQMIDVSKVMVDSREISFRDVLEKIIKKMRKNTELPFDTLHIRMIQKIIHYTNVFRRLHASTTQEV